MYDSDLSQARSLPRFCRNSCASEGSSRSQDDLLKDTRESGHHFFLSFLPQELLEEEQQTGEVPAVRRQGLTPATAALGQEDPAGSNR